MSRRARPSESRLGVAIALAVVLGGCPRWEPVVEVDAGPKPGPRGTILPRAATLAPGGTVDLKSSVTCPPPYEPCSYLWDFGDGRSSTLKDPGPTTFDKAGFYLVKLTVTGANAVADPYPPVSHVAVWNGEFKDDFNRGAMEWEKFGWRQPLLQGKTPYHDIVNGWVRIRGAWHAPGSSGLMTYAMVGDCHIEATIQRAKDTTTSHFSDIIVRMHPDFQGVATVPPVPNNVGFIRIRIQEVPPKYNNSVEVGVFKIFTAADEHGWLINDEIFHHELHHIDCVPAPQYGACPVTDNFPRDEDIRVTVDVKGPKIVTKIASAKNPSKILLELGATDDLAPIFLGEGAVGVTQFEGETFVDDFLVRRVP